MINKRDIKSLDKDTISHMAPEVAMREDYSFKSDIWAAGVIFYQILSGEHPLPSFISPDFDQYQEKWLDNGNKQLNIDFEPKAFK